MYELIDKSNRNDNNQIQQIILLKGIAIFLVVVGHFHIYKDIISSPWLRIFQNIIYMFHMQLFMLISGFLYGFSQNKVNTFGDYIVFLKKKALRLLLPYFSISFVYLVIKAIAGHFIKLENGVGVDALYNIFINPSSPNHFASFLWYIYVLGLILLFLPLIEIVLKGNKIIILLIALMLHFINVPEYFCFHLICKYLIYFWSGSILASNCIYIIHAKAIIPLFLVCLFFITVVFKSALSPIMVDFIISILGVVAACSFSLYLVVSGKLNCCNKIFLSIGKYSQVIYLYHIAAMAIIRIGFAKLPIDIGFYWMNFIFSCLIGIVCPIMIHEIVIKRSRFLCLALYGAPAI